MLEIKKKIYKHMKYAFKEDHDADESWINTNLHLQIKDTTLFSVGGRQRQKEKCEFCGRKHDMRDDICPVRSPKI
jgi:hypothetical protein